MQIDRGLATKVSEKEMVNEDDNGLNNIEEGNSMSYLASVIDSISPKKTRASITIKLNFEPSGRGITAFDGQKDDDEFYVEYRKNICVVCGHDKNYLRYQIIPSMYRMFFPDKYKSHRSHDVLLLCFN